jgi:hypothetical protein
MNISYALVSSNIVDLNDSLVLSIDLLYIGTFIGLCGGILIWCIIIYFKYKRKQIAKLDPIIQYI